MPKDESTRKDVEKAYDGKAEKKTTTVTCPDCGKKFSASNVGGAAVGGAGGGG